MDVGSGYSLPLGEGVDEIQTEGEVLGEIATTEVGEPSACDLDHRAGDGLKGGDGLYLLRQRGGIGALIVFQQRGERVHAQLIEEEEELGIHVYQQLGGLVGPLLVEEDVVVEDVVLVTTKEGI